MQPVAGFNYMLRVKVKCSSGSWDNKVRSLTLEGVVYYPLPQDPVHVVAVQGAPAVVTCKPSTACRGAGLLAKKSG